VTLDASIEADDAARDTTVLRERRCIVTGEVLPEAKLIRFVVGPDACIVPDVAAKLPGRGIWVRADRASVAKAVAKNLFARAAKAQVSADAGLPALAEDRLVAHMLSLLGLARRAGDLTLGFDQVEKALRGPRPPAVLIEAEEVAADGTRKLKAAALASGVYPFVIGCFSSAELGLALGLMNVVHASLKSGRFAEALIFEAERLAGFRALKSWVWTGYVGQDTRAHGVVAERDE
jgi:predicted RNA-binding protein YlxR (DUF448 family)